LNGGGTECYRIEGFLPVNDFAAQLEMGLAKYEFMKQRFTQAQEKYQQVCDRYADTSAAPEACYWRGVSAYKSTNNPQFLGEAAKTLREKYPDNEWARKASVWLADESPQSTVIPESRAA